jgi:D-sedoheptulose 7-phosphate isomerase
MVRKGGGCLQQLRSEPDRETLTTEAVAARAHLLESAAVKQEIADTLIGVLLAAADVISESFRSGGKLLLCGNGGSAADCQHMAAEFVSRLTRERDRPALPAIALTTDTSFLTAYSNDCGYDGVFARQVQALGKPGDVLIGISTSGNSNNVVRAVDAAKEAGMRTIVLTGNRGQLASMADVGIAVPAANTQYIQEAHLAIEHVLCSLVEDDLYGDGESGRGQ